MSIIIKNCSSFTKMNLEYGMPTRVSVWRNNRSGIYDTKNCTNFGYVLNGKATILLHDGRSYTIVPGMYFSIPEEFEISGGEGIVFSKQNYQGIFLIGGPFQENSTLKYLPGCVDSILIPPRFYGEPCLNYLNTTKGTLQPIHTHPSYRIGIVISGQGWEISELPSNRYELTTGDIFLVKPDQKHAFETTTQDLKFVVFHPNSDFGPTKNDHPLINQTLVNGKHVFIE